MNFVDETDYLIKEMAKGLVKDVLGLRKEIKRPAFQHKMTSQELWEKWGQDYVAMRNDPEMMKQTLEGMGQAEALSFSLEMEKAMEEFNA